MRLLHFRHDYGRLRLAAKKARPVRSGNHPLNEREYLPLRRVPANHQRHQTGRKGHANSRQMNEPQTPELLLEPERYELQAAALYRFEVDRREFFKLLGCGVVVLFLLDAAMAQ